MNPVLQSALSSIHGITQDTLTKSIPVLHAGLQAKVSATPVQWLDFSVSGHVIHLHIQHLEWLYGSVYRKHVKHVFLLYNFDVNGFTLKSGHETALQHFFDVVYGDHQYRLNHFLRHFETYQHPFAVNIGPDYRKTVAQNQPWSPKSLEIHDLIRQAELEKWISNGQFTPAYNGLNTYFPDCNPTTDSQLETKKITQSKYAAYKPFYIKNLLYLQPAPQSQALSFSEFTGRASKTGNENQNIRLSQQRAESVVSYLDGLLKSYSTTFDYADPELKRKVRFTGSNTPLIDESSAGHTEISENRSVYFTFEQHYDYLHIQAEETLRQTYRQTAATYNSYLQNRISNAEWCVDRNDSSLYIESQSTNPVIRKRDQLIEAMRLADIDFALGIGLIKFALHYTGDFSRLAADGGDLPSAFIPSSYVNDQHFHTDSPEGAGSGFTGLPLTYILSHGQYSTDSNVKFKLPIHPAIRLRSGSSMIDRFNNAISGEYGNMGGDNVDFIALLAQANKFINWYQNYFSKNDIRAYSFLMTAVPRERFRELIKRFSLDYTVDLSAERNEIYLKYGAPYEFSCEFSAKPFNEQLVAVLGQLQLQKYYWYDAAVLDYQHTIKKTLAKNVVKTSLLSRFTFFNSLSDYRQFGLGTIDNTVAGSGLFATTPRSFFMLKLEWMLMENV